MPQSALQRVKEIDQKRDEIFVRRRHLPSEEPAVRERAKQDKITGSITLDLSQGTVVAITLNAKVPDSV